MIGYFDTSVVLRSLLNQKQQFSSWDRVSAGISSQLLVVECHRVLDRYRLQGEITDSEIAQLKSNLVIFLRGLTLFEVTDQVLQRASGAFPSIVGTLDAIHLSTALLWKQQHKKELVILSFDEQLCTAAQALGFPLAAA